MQLKPKTRRNPAARHLVLIVLLWDLALLGIAALLAHTKRLDALPAPLAHLFRLDGANGLLGWSTLVSLFGLGLACLVLGYKSKRLGWWLSGLLFVLLSMDHLVQLGPRMGQLLSLESVRARPWTLVALPILVFCLSVSLGRTWKDTESSPSLRRTVHWALWMWGLALVLKFLQGPLGRLEQSLAGIALESGALLGCLSLRLLAPLVGLYCVVSLIELHERQKRIEERNALRLLLMPEKVKQAA